MIRSISYKLGVILNGIDTDEYNPSKDEHIYYKYNKRNFVAGKKENKLALQTELGLPEREDVPLIGIVSRLVGQKGFDLLNAVLDELMNDDIQLVVLGTGDYENMFKHYAAAYPDKVSANMRFDDALSHKIYAASDIFLMPSLFEPCGLGQIIALAYGTLPVVREVGGLKDTVTSFNEFTGEGNGFSFFAYNAHDMLFTIRRAIELYHNRTVWVKIMRNALKCDFSWQNSARSYINIYEQIGGQAIEGYKENKQKFCWKQNC
jgi:starch synthase